MVTTQAVNLLSDLAGSWQLESPLPVDGSTYVQPFVKAWDVAGYAGGDSNSNAAVSGALMLPDIDAPPTTISLVGVNDLAYVNSYTTSWSAPLPAVTILEGDLIEIIGATQEQSDPGAFNTPATYTQRWSVHNGVAWRPRVTKWYKIAEGGESGNVTITHGTSTRACFVTKVWRGVNRTTPYDMTQTFVGDYVAVNPPANTTVTDGAHVIVTTATNQPYLLSFSASDVSTGFTMDFENATTDIRGWIETSRRLDTAGPIDPNTWNIDPDNWTSVVEALRPADSVEVALAVITAVSDDTATAELGGGSAPAIAAVNEVQRIYVNETSGTFTLSYDGQTTAAIAFDATAGAVDTALENLSNIAAGEVTVTGGPGDEEPFDVEFTGGKAASSQPLITSANDVDIVRETPGRAAQSFSLVGSINIPPGASNYGPQVHVWDLVPTEYVDGAAVDITVADHNGLHSWAAVLLVLEDCDLTDPISGTFGTETAGEGSSAPWGSITPGTAGAVVLGILSKGRSTIATLPTPGVPPRYRRIVQATGDANTLDVFASAPVDAVAQSPGVSSWSGTDHYSTGLIAITPEAPAGGGSLTAALDADTDTYVELAPAAGALYEVVELDLTGIPTDAIVTGVSVQFSHSSTVRNALRVVIVGIDASGAITPAAELRPGGYIPEPLGSVQSVSTGLWRELGDGTPLNDVSRLGVAFYSTTRQVNLDSHKLYAMSATVEYEPGGPVVSNVTGPDTEGGTIDWTYSSSGGLGQTHSQVRVLHGFGEDPEEQFEDHFFYEFPTVGAGSTVLTGPEWNLYNSEGHAGNGLRRPSAIDVVADATSTSGGNVLRITASNGTGPEAGEVVSGGLKIVKNLTYGQIEFRARATGDPDQIFSPVIIMWPTEDPVRFPDSNNASGTDGEWPAGGELDMMENFANRDTLDPVESHIHRLKIGAVPPYDGTDDETLNFTHAIIGTAWHKHVFTWLPGSLHLEIDNGIISTTLTTDPLWIPDWNMDMTIQLDAHVDATPLSGGNNPELRVDYVVLRRLVDQQPAVNPLNPVDGEIVVDTGKVAGSLRRSYLIEDHPLPLGNKTATVRAWARTTTGLEVRSAWDTDDLFTIPGNPPATGTQSTNPVFNVATGGVDIALVTPAGVSRAWLIRSLDSGSTWTLLAPFNVSASSNVVVTDYRAPLAAETIRYQVAFDNGPVTETALPEDVGTIGDIATPITEWYLICPEAPTLNTTVEVAAFDATRPRSSVVAEQPGRSVVASSRPLPRRITCTFRARTAAERAAIDAVLDSDEVIRLVNILGREWYVRPVGDMGESLQRWMPLPTETTGLRDAHTVSVTFAEVGEPS